MKYVLEGPQSYFKLDYCTTGLIQTYYLDLRYFTPKYAYMYT